MIININDRIPEKYLTYPNLLCKEHNNLCKIIFNCPYKGKVSILCPECDKEEWKKH